MFIDKIKEACNADYDGNIKGVESATSLMKPVQEVLLSKRYKGLLRETDHSKANIGTLIHKGMEVFFKDDKDLLQEVRLFTEINGVEISGKFDAYNIYTYEVIDYKSTSTYKWKQPKDDYILQLSIYNFLLFKNGYKTGLKGVILFFFTDWKQSFADKDETYPQSAIVELQLDLMSLDDTLVYLKSKIASQLLYANKHDGALPKCSDEDRWIKESKWVVQWYTKSGALALKPKKFESKSEAIEFAAIHGTVPEELKSEPTKCISYCPVSEFCSQHRAYLETSF